MVVNSDRIRNLGKPVLHALTTLIKENPEHRWGYTYESFWQNLFMKDHEMRPRGQILEKLHAGASTVRKTKASETGRMQRGSCQDLM